MQEAAKELDRGGATPFAGFVSDPCDGRTQGTLGMIDSLAYRNDAAIVFRRLIRSLPTRRGVMGVATCDKGLPAMMLALAAQGELPVIIVPGGVTLPPTVGEDAGAVQTVGVRFTHGKLTLARGGRARLRGLRDAGRRLPVPRHGRHQPGGGRGARALALPLRARALGPAGLARPGAALGARAAGHGRRRPGREGHRHRRRRPQRDGRARGLRRLDQSAAARSRDRARGGPPAARRRGLGARQPRRAAHRRRAAERPRRPPDRARLPRRRRARGDAAPARPRAPAARRHDRAPAAARRRARRVGAQRPPHARARAAARARRHRSRRRHPHARARERVG